jgi:hypothetical protein
VCEWGKRRRWKGVPKNRNKVLRVTGLQPHISLGSYAWRKQTREQKAWFVMSLVIKLVIGKTLSRRWQFWTGSSSGLCVDQNDSRDFRRLTFRLAGLDWDHGVWTGHGRLPLLGVLHRAGKRKEASIWHVRQLASTFQGPACGRPWRCRLNTRWCAYLSSIGNFALLRAFCNQGLAVHL